MPQVKTRKLSNLIILVFLTAFIVFSIYGAFLGAEKAKAFFNSPRLIIFWCLLLVFMLLGFLVYASLRKRLSLLLIHLGFVLVLTGGMIGSEKGLVVSRWAVERLGQYIPWLSLSEESSEHGGFTEGMITLGEGQWSDEVFLRPKADEQHETAKLPFRIRLKEAYLEYYDTPNIRFYVSRDQFHTIPVEVGRTQVLPDDAGTIEIVAAYKNFKMKMEDGRMKPFDSPAPGFNPAYELIYIPKDKPAQPFFVFERQGMHARPGQTFWAEFVPPRMVKDYKSTLQVIDDNQIVKEETIEVNKPLYYGGYHFYQNTFSFDQFGPVSGIQVASARGVWTVFVGYGIIFVGLLMQFWNKLSKRLQYDMAGGAR